jgi:tetratricopeptide (TPR) repeat protein
MPSHIFIQHGMWDRVVKSNDASYDSAIRLWRKRDGLTDTEKFYNDVYIWHALDWGQYGQLQLGDYEKAKKSIALLKPVAAISKTPITKDGVTRMAARYVVESEQWSTETLGDDATPEEIFATGMSAVKLGETAAAEKAETKLTAMYEERKAKDGEAAALSLGIMAKELAALVRVSKGQGSEAIELMKEATAMAESMSAPAGTATPIKPAYELYGEILLELGKADEATEQFETSLLRMQNRTLSLRGMARASKMSGDAETARASYEKLLEILGDYPENPSYKEAKGFVSDGE